VRAVLRGTVEDGAVGANPALEVSNIMATVAVPSMEASSLPYRSFLRSGLVAIVAVGAVVCSAAVLAFAAVSATAGLVLLGVAFALLCVDAVFATPTRIVVEPGGVRFGWWGRERSYTADALVARYDARRERLTIARPNRATLADVKHDAATLAAALAAVGVEVDAR
jgi:hypothetical protein